MKDKYILVSTMTENTQEENNMDMVECALNEYWKTADVSIVSMNNETKQVTLIMRTTDGKTYKAVIA